MIAEISYRLNICQISFGKKSNVKLNRAVILPDLPNFIVILFTFAFLVRIKMRFLEVLFLLGFFLVFVKAQGGTVGDEAFIEEEHDMAAGEAALEDEPEEEFKRQVIPPRPPMRRFVTVPLAIPPNANGRFFRLCYCFRRRCYGN